MGIYPPAVCQMLSGKNWITTLSGVILASDSLPPPPGDRSNPTWLCGDKCVVNHLLLWQNKMLWDNMQASHSNVVPPSVPALAPSHVQMENKVLRGGL